MLRNTSRLRRAREKPRLSSAASAPRNPAPRGRPPTRESQSGREPHIPSSSVQNSVRSQASIARHSGRPAPLPPPLGAPPASSGGAAPAQIGRRSPHTLRKGWACESAHDPFGDLFLAPWTFFSGGCWYPGIFRDAATAVEYHRRRFWGWGVLVLGVGTWGG